MIGPRHGPNPASFVQCTLTTLITMHPMEIREYITIPGACLCNHVPCLPQHPSVPISCLWLSPKQGTSSAPRTGTDDAEHPNTGAGPRQVEHERQSRSASSHVISEPVSGLAHHFQAWSPDWPALTCPEITPHFGACARTFAAGCSSLVAPWQTKQAGRHPPTSRSQRWGAHCGPPSYGQACDLHLNQATSCRGR